MDFYRDHLGRELDYVTIPDPYGKSLRIVGCDVHCHRNAPHGRIYFIDEDFWVSPGRYKIEDFIKVKTRHRMLNGSPKGFNALHGDKIICHPDMFYTYNGAFKSYLAQKEKEVTQYQALLPVDLEKHLYAGSTLYDLEKHEFRKISTVSKVSRKTGYTTTITFVGGAKKVFTNQNTLEAFGRVHKWVTLRDLDDDPTLRYDIPTRSWVEGRINAAYKGPDTIHHYSRIHGQRGDTDITHIGMVAIQELVAEQVVESMKAEQKRNSEDRPTPAVAKKRRWFK